MKVNHLKVNIGNNVMHLFLYVDYLTLCFRSDNIENFVLQGRQHPKKKCHYECAVSFPLTSAQ